jgi:mannose-6-phosphate isomerase-like protein (cupin superfamily)
MDKTCLEIRDYSGAGYQPLVDFGAWRVAMLRYLDGIHPENNHRLERHTETDEVFVLLQGKGVLIIGGNEGRVSEIFPQAMEAGKIYNVRCNTWHTILLSREASVLIVENQDTGETNSEYLPVPVECRQQMVEIAQRERI